MKKVLTNFLALSLFTLLTNCTPSETFQGTYTCSDCLYTELNFKNDGTVEISAGGIKAPGEFEVAEQKVTITTETSEYVFTIKDDSTLEGEGDVDGTYKKGI